MNSRFLHVADTAVIAKAFPQLDDLLFRRRRKGCYIRKFPDKALKIRFHSLHPCLLEHDFRYPGIIGIVFISPGQNPFVFIVPFQKGFCNVFRHIVSFL